MTLDSDYEINVDVDMANGDAVTVFINYRIGVTGMGLTVNAIKQQITRYQNAYDRNILFIDQAGAVKLSSFVKDPERHELEPLQQILQDKALYAAKHQGRNQISTHG